MTTFADTGLEYVTPVTVTSKERVVRSETLNLKIQTVDNDSQRWEIKVDLKPIFDTGSDTAIAELNLHRFMHGAHTSFDTNMPQYPGTESSDTNASFSEDHEVNDDWAVGVSYTEDDIVYYDDNDTVYICISPHTSSNANTPLNTTLWSELELDADGYPVGYARAGDSKTVIRADRNADLKRGHFIAFNGHSKVYMVTKTAVFREDGFKAIEFFPALVRDIEDDEILHHNEVDIKVFYAQDGQEGYTVTDGSLVSATVSLIEDLPPGVSS